MIISKQEVTTLKYSYEGSPIIDHHQHLFSPGIAALLNEVQVITADDVIGLLDTAGIRKALLLSAAYIYGSASKTVDDEYAKVRAENDWTGVQASLYPERLLAFCSFNPLKEYALDELKRCAGNPMLRGGIKLHFGNSDVQLDNPEHVKQLKRVFQAANEHRMAIVVHLRASISRQRPYGPEQALVFLEQLLPLAPDSPVQVAHLAGAGPGYDDPPAQSVMTILAEAIEKCDPRTSQLFFDVATVSDLNNSPANEELITRLIRQVGVDRIVYGSDAAAGDNLRPREGWAAFCRLPLLKEELEQIASNVAPYFHRGRK